MATSNKLPPLPTELLILGTRFRVEGVDSIDGDDTVGDMTGFYRRIRIDTTMNLARQWRVLLHEATHAIIHVIGADAVISNDMNEVLTTSMEHGLEQLLRQHGAAIVAAVSADEE